MEIPEGLMRLLAKNCDEQDYGLAMMQNEAGITILLMGPKPIGAGLAALSAASMILNDVITGLVNQNRPVPDEGPPN
jgi:hypothetical protein